MPWRTTALVFGAHFASAVEILFTAAERRRLRITAGQVLSDRLLRPELLTTPEVALAEGRKLIERWHGDSRLRYAVTPRFSLSASAAGRASRCSRRGCRPTSCSS